MKYKIMYILLILLSILFIWFLTGYSAAHYFTKSANCEIYERDLIADVKPINLIIETKDQQKIAAWLVNKNPEKIIILLSGIKGNRTDMLRAAEFFVSKNYSVLMPDLRATGESSGNFVSFGWHEKNDLLACISVLRSRGFHRISAYGISLGAATIIYASPYFTDFEFVILSSSYDNIEHAFRNRIKKFHLPDFIYTPVIYFIEKKIGAKTNELSPVEIIKNIKCPTLILAGDCETQIPLHETQQIFANCGAKNKQLHIFKGGRHQDFFKHFPEEFEEVVSTFISQLK